MKRFASHFVFLPAYGGYLKQYAVETEGGIAVRLFPLTEEVEDVEWLPGAIALLSQDELKELGTNTASIKFPRNLLAAPPHPADGGYGLFPVYFSGFDITTMLPAAGTRHRQLP